MKLITKLSLVLLVTLTVACDSGGGGGETNPETDGTSDGLTDSSDGTDGGLDGSDGGLDGSSDSADGSDGGLDGSSDSADGSDGGLDGSSDSADGSDGGLDGSSDSADGSDGGTDAGTDGSSDGSTDGFDGSEPAVSDLYSEEQLNALLDLGLTVHLGDSPPVIEGSFFSSPTTLQASSVPGDEGNIGAQFADALITFSNQDAEALTVDLLLDEANGVSVTVGEGSFISGSGSNFTVYFVSTTDLDGALADTTVTISGTVSAAGIENYQMALFMLDNRGNSDIFIDNNTGRLFIDGDGFTERVANGSVPVRIQISSGTPGTLFGR